MGFFIDNDGAYLESSEPFDGVGFMCSSDLKLLNRLSFTNKGTRPMKLGLGVM